MSNEIDIAFELLRAALNVADEHSSTQSLSHSATQSLSSHEWWNLFRLLQQNHVAALTADTMASLEVPREVKIPWLAERDKAERWHRYQAEVQQEILDTLERQGIETLVLKGTHISQYYPQPELREFGDLDLYFYDKHDEADRLTATLLQTERAATSHHHTKYTYRGVTVESHYDFVNRHYPPSNRRYEELLKEQAPSPTFEVLFLLRHMAGHFAASRITLRDLVDWTLTCRALNDKVEWDKVERAIHDFGMTKFSTMLNSIAESRLGSQPLSYSDAQSLIEHDIVYGSMDDSSADGVGRLGWKLRRWRALGWKRKMVYNDNSLRLFLASMTSHTMKPQSILHKM